jgi:tetratricopeptide (TPR) repeat protein
LAQDAGDELAAALRLNPRYVVAQAALGQVLAQQLGRVDEAIAAFQTALQMDPEMEQAREGLARAQASIESAKAAAGADRARVERDPKDALARLELAVSEARSGDRDAAVQELRRSIELDPRVGRAHADLALLLYLRKDYAAALREAQSARERGFPPPADLVRMLQRQTGP